MERERKIFQTYLAMHAHKARPTEEPVAHLQWHADTLPLDAPLWRLTRAEVVEALDPSSDLVRWLLEQLRTYDCMRQCVVGLVYDKQTVLSDVLHVPPE
tara:strand:- start:18 stop:314 length:297 start_codon:yes stop_codon:yes gene_type:complete